MALVFTSPSGPAGAIVEIVSPTGNVKSLVLDLAASLTSSSISNVSTVTGATVTDALNTIGALLSGDVYSFLDDFDASISGGVGVFTVAAGAVLPTGENNWFAQSLGTAAGGSIVQGAVPLPNHPGILRLVTAVAINDALFMHKGAFNNGTSQFMLASDVSSARVVAQLPAITSVRAYFGFATALNSATFGAEAAAFLFDSSLGVNWRAVVRRGGVEVSADTGILAVVGDWRDFLIVQTTPGNWVFFIDGLLVATLASPAGAAGGVNCGAFVQALVAGGRELQLDLFRVQSVPLNRTL